jgi:FKBP-type peptidyl-prolyl cis-trans isomerase
MRGQTRGSRRRLVAALVVPLLLVLAGCGGGGTTIKQHFGTIADVTVSGPTDAKPRVHFKAPLSFRKTQRAIVVKGPGKGDAVAKQSIVTVDYVGYNASDDVLFDSSWSRGQTATFPVHSVIKGFQEGLMGAHAGDRVLIAVPPKDAYDPSGNGSTVRKGDSVVFVVDVRKVVTPKIASVADVTVTGKPGSQPKVSFDAPLQFDTTTHNTVVSGPGKGPAVSADTPVTVEFVGYDALTGRTIANTWLQGKPKTVALSTLVPGLQRALEGAHAGDRIVAAVSSADGFPNGDGVSVKPGDSLVYVADVVDVPQPLPHAEGTKVSTPPTVPSLVLKGGVPSSFKVSLKEPAHVTKLGVYPVIRGTGAKVRPGDHIAVQYLGAVYPGKTIFHSSWSNKVPFTFQVGVGGVISGWDKGLVGQRVGSRVILTVPSQEAYGAQGSPPKIPPNADLVFAIDILQAY